MPGSGASPFPVRAIACLMLGCVLAGFGGVAVFLLEGQHVAALDRATEAEAASNAQMRLLSAGVLLVGCLLLFAGVASRTGGMRYGVAVLVAVAVDLGAAAGGWLQHGVLKVGLPLPAGCVLLAALALRILRRRRAAPTRAAGSG